MAKRSDKGPFVARGAKRAGQVEVEVRARVLEAIALEVKASVPPEFVEMVVGMARDYGEGAALGFAGSFARSFFSHPAVQDGFRSGMKLVGAAMVGVERVIREEGVCRGG